MLPENTTFFVPSTEEEWLAWRKGGIGASIVAALFNEHPFYSKYKIWEMLVQPEPLSSFETLAMKKGKEIESKIIALFRKEEAPAILKDQICLQEDIIRCTLDLWAFPDGPIFEIKYYQNQDRYDRLTEIPIAHWWQMQQQLMLSGAPFGYYIVSRDGENYKRITLYPSAQAFERIREAIYHFWENHVLPQIPPESSQKKSLEDHSILAKKCERLRELMLFIQEAECLKEEIREMATEPFVHKGIGFNITPVKGRIDYEAIFKDAKVQQALAASGIFFENLDHCRKKPKMTKHIYFCKNT